MVNVIDIRSFGEKFGCEVSTLPANLLLMGWSENAGWFCAPRRNVTTHAFDRVRPTGRLFEKHVLPRLSRRSFWFLLCFWDGWRERHVFADRYTWIPATNLEPGVEWRGAPGELPIFSPGRRWIACYCAHRGDPSAVLLPEPHYLGRQGYTGLFAELGKQQLSWEERRPRAVFCGSDHGDVANYFPSLVLDRPHPRRYLQRIVDEAKLDIDVHLGRGVSLAQQTSYRWILDVDGFTRTWDAFAWKIRSGSVMLSTASPWESFFTRQFEPWRHYVPVANDFSDLAQRLEWCRANDDECREIAERARRQAESVYSAENVARTVAQQWQTLLTEPQATPDVAPVRRIAS